MDVRKRIVMNTLAQHFRAILNTGMSLYSTRFILSALGNSDFGIFALVGSMVTMLGFITNALVVTTQRHLSFSYGTNDKKEVKRVFASSLFIHIVIGFAFIAILLSIKPLLFGGFLNIQSSRIYTASTVYMIMVFVLFVTFVTSPFKALFISHENIVYISIVDVLDGVFKLVLAITLLYMDADRLLVYAWMVMGIALFNFSAFSIYAKRNFEETQIIPHRTDINKTSIKKILDFAVWTIYSTGCIIGRNQGMAIVLNRFFGTIINTSYGITMQVAGAVQFIAQSVLNAMSPQIIKSEGVSNRKRMLKLSESTCKYAFLLLSMAVIPLVFEMPAILSFWLGDTPEYTVTFCRFILIASVIDQTTIGLGVANQAIGDIRTYSIVVNTIKVMTLPIAWLCLQCGLPVVSTMWCYVAIESVCAIIRLPFLKYTAGLSIMHYMSHVLLRIILPTLSLIAIGWLITSTIQTSFRLLITITMSIIIDTIVIWQVSLTEEERNIARNMIKISRKK